MIVNPKVKATPYQSLSFYVCSTLGGYAIIRNAFRIHRYLKSYKAMMASLEKYRHNFDQIQKIKTSQLKDKALLQAVFPNFAPRYFQNTQNFAKYKTSQGRFYEQLECDSGFEGYLRNKGREETIYCEMNKPAVGFQLATNCLKFDEMGIKFHRNQMIAVYGELTYEKDKKRYLMKSQMVGLDVIQFVKFWQSKVLATIISTFYFGLLLGICVSLWLKLSISLPHQLYNRYTR